MRDMPTAELTKQPDYVTENPYREMIDKMGNQAGSLQFPAQVRFICAPSLQPLNINIFLYYNSAYFNEHQKANMYYVKPAEQFFFDQGALDRAQKQREQLERKRANQGAFEQGGKRPRPQHITCITPPLIHASFMFTSVH